MTFKVWLRSGGQQAAQCNFALAKRQEQHSWVPDELPAELIIRIKIHVGVCSIHYRLCVCAFERVCLCVWVYSVCVHATAKMVLNVLLCMPLCAYTQRMNGLDVCA